MAYSYEELNSMSLAKLQEIKEKELDRITEQENKRQQLIGSIIALQNINDHTDL